MNNGSVVCTNCILHYGFLGIELNSDGLCNFCADPDHKNPNWSKIRISEPIRTTCLRDWEDTVQAMKRTHNGKDYDCVIGYSGGKDSTALVDTFITEYDLNPLLVTVDTGFMTDVAKQNICDTLTKMDFYDNYILIEKAVPTFYKLYKYFFFNHISNDKTLTVGICHTCTDLIHTIVVKEAIKRSIPYVIIGFSPDQIARYFYETVREDIIKDSVLEKGLSREFDATDLKLYLSEKDIAGKIPRVLYPYHVIEYDEAEIIGRIEAKGLIETGRGDPVLTNCHVVKAAIMYDFFRYGGIPYALQYAELVRQDNGLRKKWLRTVNQVSRAILNGNFNKDGMELFFNNIGVSWEELMERIEIQRASDPNKKQIIHNIQLIKDRKLK